MPEPTSVTSATEQPPPLSAEGLPTETDVLVIGAGLAGLACAQRLHQSAPDLTVTLVERGDRVGGRVGTDVIDGFRCDRGFQLLNPAYPEARRALDLKSLLLQPFPTAAAVYGDEGTRLVGDPRRLPATIRYEAIRGALAQAKHPKEAAALGRWVASCTRRDAADLVSQPDSDWFTALDGAEVHGPIRYSVLEPFLAGVLAETDGSSSRRFVELLVRSFVRGRPSVPWAGMQALPDQMVAALPPGSVHTGVEVSTVVPQLNSAAARTSRGTVSARVIVVATDPASFTQLTGQSAPATRALTTYWHAARANFDDVASAGVIHLDGTRSSAVVNTVVVSAVARAYSPDDRALVATTVLGVPDGSATDRRAEGAVRQALSRIYRTSTTSWDLVATHPIAHALTAMLPPLELRRPVVLPNGLLVAGDHRDTASIQGALVSGRRAGDAALERLGRRIPSRAPLDALSGRRRPQLVPGLDSLAR